MDEYQTYLIKCTPTEYEKYKDQLRKAINFNELDTLEIQNNIWIVLQLTSKEYGIIKKLCDMFELTISLDGDIIKAI